MLSPKDLFQALPDEIIQTNILPTLSTSELLRLAVQYNTTNKDAAYIHYEFILRELFSRHQSHKDITYQLKYLQHANQSLLKTVISNHTLRKTLKDAMTSPFSTLEHKLHILHAENLHDIATPIIQQYLRAIGDIILGLYKIVIKIIAYVYHRIVIESILLRMRFNKTLITKTDPQTLIPKLKKSDVKKLNNLLFTWLDDDDQKVCKSALETIAVIAPKLDNSDAQKFVAHLFTKLNHDNKDVCGAAFRAIAILTPKLEGSYLSTLVEPLLAKLNNNSHYDRCNALDLIAVFASKLDNPDAQKFVEPLHARLNDKHEWVRGNAFHVIAILAPKLKKSDLHSFVKPLLFARNDRLHALETIAAIAPNLEYSDLHQFVHHLLGKLDDKDCLVRGATLKAIAAIALNLKSGDLLTFIHPLLARLDKEYDQYLRKAILETITAITPKLESSDLEQLLEPLFAKLDNDHEKPDVRYAALETIKIIISREKSYDRKPIKFLLTKLHDKTEHARRTALIAIRSIASKLSSSEVLKLLDPLLARLGNAESDVHKVALEIIAAIAPKLENADLHKFIEPLFARLEDQKWDVSAAALKAIVAIAPKLKNSYVKKLMDFLLSRTLLDSGNENILSHLITVADKTLLSDLKKSLSTQSSYFFQDKLQHFLIHWEKMNISIPKEKLQAELDQYHSKSWLSYFKSLWFWLCQLPEHQSKAICELKALCQINDSDISQAQIENALSQDPHKTKRVSLFFQGPGNNALTSNSGTDDVIIALHNAFNPT